MMTTSISGLIPLTAWRTCIPFITGHLVIEKDQVIVALPDPPDRLIAVFGLADGVALLPEKVTEHLTLRLAVFHHQNVELLHSAFAPLPSLMPFRGKQDLEGRSLSFAAQDADLTAMPADDLMGEGKSEPQPLLLCRVFGIEDPLHLFGRHPAPRVGDPDGSPAPSPASGRRE